MQLESICDIADQYDTFLVDMWGVVYDGVHAFPDAIAALNTLKEQGKTIIFVSNNPRPSELAKTTLQELGLKGDVDIVTSGDVMRSILQEKHLRQKVYHLGRARNKDLLGGLDIHMVDDIRQSDFVLLSCFLEEAEDFTQFDRDLELMAKHEILVYCPNPDSYAAHHQTLRKTAGFFAHRLEDTFGGKAVRIGKPDRSIFNFVQNSYPQALRTKERTLMIGDTLTTDIKGGNDYGVATLFVEGGISGAFNASSDVQPTYIIKILK